MIKYRKILAQLLAASMIFTSFAVPVTAAETEELAEETAIVEDVVEEETADVVTAEEDVDGAGVTTEISFEEVVQSGTIVDGAALSIGTGKTVKGFTFKQKENKDDAANFKVRVKNEKAYCFEFGQKKAGWMEFTVPEGKKGSFSANITSTGGSNKSPWQLDDSTGEKVVGGLVEGTSQTKVSSGEELLAAGTYTFYSVEDSANNRGFRFYSASLTLEDAAALTHVTVSFNGAKEGNKVFDLTSKNVAGQFTLSANQISEVLALTVDGGYDIVAWTDGTDEIENDAAELEDLTFESDVVFTPVTSQKFSVKFADIDDTGKTETVQVNNGSKTRAADIPKAEKTMKEFTGWTVGDDATLISSADIAKKVVTADVTYTANYSAVEEAPHDTADLVAITGKAVFTGESFAESTDLKVPTVDDKGIKKWTLKKWKTNMSDDKFQFIITNQSINKDGIVTAVNEGAYLQTYKDTDVAFTDIDGNAVDAPANISRRLVLGGATFSMENNMDLLSRGVLFKTSEPGIVKVYWSSAKDLASASDPDAKLGLFYAKKDGKAVEIAEGAKDKAPLESLADPDYLTSRSKGAASLDTMIIPAAGEYAIGGFKLEGKNTNAIIYRIEVITDSYEEPVDPTKPDDPTDPSNPESTDDGEVDTFDAKGDPVLSAATAEKVSANYAKLAAGGTVNGVQAAIGDTGVLNYEFKKPGKVKAITISTNSVSDCRVTVNAKAKVILPAAFTGGEKMVSATPVAVSGNSAKLKALKANKKGVVSLKAFKGCAVYDVTFTNSKKEKITIRVVNLAFDKAIKKIQMSASQNLIVRPTMLYDNKTNKITEGAGFLNGVWSVGKTPITKPGTVPDEKTGAKVTLSANGIVTVTGLKNKGSLKLTYTLNGRKYTTALKVQKKAGGAEDAYKKAGLLK